MQKIALYSTNTRVTKRYTEILSESYSLKTYTDIERLIDVVDEDTIILLHDNLTPKKLIDTLDTIYEIIERKNTLVLKDIVQLHEGEALLIHHIGGYGNVNMTDVVLTQALEIIASGNVWLYPELMTHIISKMNDINAHENITTELDGLSPREQEVAKLIAEGKSNQVISEELNISQSTVKLHVHSVFEKLHVKSRIALAILINKGQ